MKIDLMLQTLKEAGEVVTDVFFTDYYNSYRNIYHYLYGRERFISKKNFNRDRHNFHNLLFYLRRQGFIKKREINNRNFWSLTRTGIAKLNRLLERRSSIRNTEKEKDFQKVIVFDIPEKEKYKRFWLRSQLNLLGFRMLQKSVWIGDSKLPKEFLKDLHRLKLLRCVHIFGTSKGGTLDLIELQKENSGE